MKKHRSYEHYYRLTIKRSNELFSLKFEFHDFSIIKKWLKDCENDIKRGHDQPKYIILVKVFIKNEYLRVDSFLRELFVHNLLLITSAQDIQVMHDLVLSVLLFAKKNIDRIKRKVKYQ